LVKGILVFISRIDEELNHIGIINKLAVVTTHIGTISVDFGEASISGAELGILHHIGI
jgi:hypothetical protein